MNASLGGRYMGGQRNEICGRVSCISVSKHKFKNSDQVGGHQTCPWDLFVWDVGRLGGGGHNVFF